MRGATRRIDLCFDVIIFQPTRPLRGATWRSIRRSRICWISTHAPLAGRDRAACCGGRCEKIFQPTRPLRGATRAPAAPLICSRNFNPRAPCGARQADRAQGRSRRNHFNPRAPCGARRQTEVISNMTYAISTHAPLAGRDGRGRPPQGRSHISTHAPLAGRDVIAPQILGAL